MVRISQLCRSNLIVHGLGLAAICGALTSCNDAGSSAREDLTSSLALRLTLSNARLVNTVHYVITRLGTPLTFGDFNFAAASSLSFRIGGLPAGAGYLVELSTVTVDGVQRCTGQAPFSTIAGAVTAVNVMLSCADIFPSTGSIDVNAQFNHCPTIASMVVLPLTAKAGEAIELIANGRDSDLDDVLNYTWSDGAGTFANMPNAHYICPLTLDPTVLTLRVNDGRCITSDTVTIACHKDGLCGDGVLDPGEACDDGNTSNTDACPNTCMAPHCGNGVIEGGEDCDDGNTIEDATCPANCHLNACPLIDSLIFEPFLGNPGEPVHLIASVHDDDTDAVLTYAWSDSSGVFANTSSADYICPFASDPIPIAFEVNDGRCTDREVVKINCFSIILGVCGDGFVDGDELCDDGNVINTDACPNDCTPAFCGDAVLEGDEECDDGNIFDDATCPHDCHFD